MSTERKKIGGVEKDVTFEIETVSTSEEKKKKLTEVSNYKISQLHCITDALGCQERMIT